MQGTGIIANKKVIPIDTKNGKYSVSFQFQIPNATPDAINIPGVFFGNGSLAIFSIHSLSVASLPPINNISGTIGWDDTTPDVISPLLIYVPSTGELVAVQPEDPTLPGAGASAVHCATSFSVPLLPCEEIWLIKEDDSAVANPSRTNINLVCSTFDRPVYRQGV